MQQPPAPSPSTVHQETYLPTPPPLKLPSPTLPPKTPRTTTATQCEVLPNLKTAQGILFFISRMFNKTSEFPFMQIQSTQIKDLVKLKLLCFLHQSQSKHCFEYSSGTNVEIIQANPKKSSIFSEKNESNITFPENFDTEITQILEQSNLQIPPEMRQTFFNIITARQEGSLLREQNGQIRFIP